MRVQTEHIGYTSNRAHGLHLLGMEVNHALEEHNCAR